MKKQSRKPRSRKGNGKGKGKEDRFPGLGFEIENWDQWDQEIHDAACSYRDWYGMYPNRVYGNTATCQKVRKAFWASVTSHHTETPCNQRPTSLGDSSSTGAGEYSSEEFPELGRFFFTTEDYNLCLYEEESLPAGTLVLVYIPDA